jgi:CBS domain-containing protein
LGCILVVDEQQHLVGIITDRDLLVRMMGKGLNPATIKVDDIMTPSPESLCANDPIAFALNRMHLGHYRHIPLIVSDGERGYPVGVVSSKDILNHVATFLETHQEE